MWSLNDEWGDDNKNDKYKFDVPKSVQEKIRKKAEKKDKEQYTGGLYVRARPVDSDEEKYIKQKKVVKNGQGNEIAEAKKSKKRKLANEINEDSNKSKIMKIDKSTKIKQPATQSSDKASFSQKLRDNLKGSRFRFINEQLYQNNGKVAFEIFKKDPEAFNAYHEGYRGQVEHWPMNPLKRMINAIKRIPKSEVIADFGCGEGRLAKSVPHKVYSLDLVAANDDVIACDMAQTPLKSNSINVVIFCLSLMGTNLKDFLLEANRVLKINGKLKIAEVTSRFDSVPEFIKNIEKCGFSLLNKDLTHNLFVFMDFKKIQNIDKTASRQISSFSLKPCLYKKR